MSWTESDNRTYIYKYRQAMVLVEVAQTLLLKAAVTLKGSFPGGGQSTGTTDDMCELRAYAKILDVMWDKLNGQAQYIK